MMSRALLFAAVAAFASAADDTMHLQCGPCGECCEFTDKFVQEAGGVYKCKSPADDICELCVNDPCVKSGSFVDGTGLSGSTSGGGASVGTIVTIANPMPGFTGLAGSTFNKFEDWMLGARATRIDANTTADYTIRYQCKDMKDLGAAACDLFLFVFRCNPCRATNSGALHAYLIAAGWKAHYCGPIFKFGAGTHEHPFITYHKETATDYEYVTPGVEADLIFPALGAKSLLCSDKTDKDSCNSCNTCTWDDAADECTTGWCPKRDQYVGPSTGCQICPQNEDGTYNLDL